MTPLNAYREVIIDCRYLVRLFTSAASPPGEKVVLCEARRPSLQMTPPPLFPDRLDMLKGNHLASGDHPYPAGGAAGAGPDYAPGPVIGVHFQTFTVTTVILSLPPASFAKSINALQHLSRLSW